MGFIKYDNRAISIVLSALLAAGAVSETRWFWEDETAMHEGRCQQLHTVHGTAGEFAKESLLVFPSIRVRTLLLGCWSCEQTPSTVPWLFVSAYTSHAARVSATSGCQTCKESGAVSQSGRGRCVRCYITYLLSYLLPVTLYPYYYLRKK